MSTHTTGKGMKNSKLLYIGIVGSLVTALCCFTPVLVVLFGAVGLSAAVGYLDYVLLPTLAVFIIITIYALMKKYS
jgi:mercuric ion transport protein